MTVLNTSYTTLEEAWGDDFRKQTKSRQLLSQNKKQDPLCQLYGRKYQKMRKPFLDKSTEIKNGKNYKTTGISSRNRYFGYNDDNIEDHNKSECIQHNKKRSSIKSKKKGNGSSSKNKGVRFNIETEDDDDIYLHNAIKDEEILNEQEFDDELIEFEEMNNVRKFYSDVYEESDDEDYDLPEPETNNHLVDVEEENMIYNRSLHNNYNKKSSYCNQYKDERQYFDLIIYMLSGIILIFMMEQFIQIGMRLKVSTI